MSRRTRMVSALAISSLCAVLANTPIVRAEQASGIAPPPATHVPNPPPEPRPALKKPKAGAFPFKTWSYAKAYTYNFFEDRPVPMRVVSEDAAWSPHIRSEQLIDEKHARRSAELVAVTRGSIEMTKCTFPRHAVVYFDRADKPVASVDVCFSCEAVLAWPDYERRENYNYERAASKFEKTLPLWRRLFEKELGLPTEYKTAPAQQ